MSHHYCFASLSASDRLKHRLNIKTTQLTSETTARACKVRNVLTWEGQGSWHIFLQTTLDDVINAGPELIGFFSQTFGEKIQPRSSVYHACGL